MPPEIPIYARIPNSVQEALAHTSDNDFAIAVDNLLFARAEAVGYAGMTAEERVVYCLNGLERELNNGGFKQFFSNAAGDRAADTPAALRAMGATQVAAIVEQANAVFPDGPSSSRDAREGQIDALPKSAKTTWSALTKKFLNYPEPLAELERAYVTAHQGAFGIPPRAGMSL